MSRRFTFGFLIVIAAFALTLALPAGAQDNGASPMIDVSDQLVLDGTVTIAQAYSDGPGFIVIHADGGDGSPGPVIGYRSINAGQSLSVEVPIDAAAATPTLFAMLHADTGEVGVYEFGTVEGADGPVRVNDAVITPAFGVNVIHAQDQFVSDGSVQIASVTAAEPGWLVIHSDADGQPGPVLGQTLVEAGTTANVSVSLNGEATGVLWPMLHLDTGAAGEYEFGTVEGADGPVRVNEQVAVTRFWTVPHMRIADQIVMHGDSMAMDMMGAPTLVADSVLSEGPGWLVIHSEADGGPGPVLGSAPVQAGLNTGVTVELSAEGLTPNLWPMLHVDTGEAGVYEFGTVEGVDGPVVVGDSPLTFAIKAAPSLTLTDGELVNGTHLVIAAALIDAHGWLVIHSSQDGAPGPVLTSYPLPKGLSTDIMIEVDPAAAGAQVFPMLHYDTGEAGVYEFGTVEGADGPVQVGGQTVVGPLNITGGQAASDMGGDSMALDGAQLVETRCTVCHTRDRIDAANKTPAEWEATVQRMIGNGAQLTPEEQQAVVEYLSNR